MPWLMAGKATGWPKFAAFVVWKTTAFAIFAVLPARFHTTVTFITVYIATSILITEESSDQFQWHLHAEMLNSLELKLRPVVIFIRKVVVAKEWKTDNESTFDVQLPHL